MDVLHIVKMLLHINDTESDALLLLYIDICKQSILEYCNINELPQTLCYELANMTVDMYHENMLLSSLKIDDEDAVEPAIGSTVSSITEGSRTVSFDTKDANSIALSNLQKLRDSANEKVSNLKILSRYRQLYR